MTSDALQCRLLPAIYFQSFLPAASSHWCPHLVLPSGPLQVLFPLLWTLFPRLLKPLPVTCLRPLLISYLPIDLLGSLSERLYLIWNHPTLPYFSSKYSSTTTYIYSFSGILTIQKRFNFSYSSLNSCYLEECLMHKRQSIDVCEVDKWMSLLPSHPENIALGADWSSGPWLFDNIYWALMC